MFAKLLVLIVALGATACMLLVNRQHRIDAAHEMARIHERLVEHKRDLWRLNGEISGRCRPQDIRAAMEVIPVAWVPIPTEPLPDHSAAVRLAGTTDDRTEFPGFGG